MCGSVYFAGLAATYIANGELHSTTNGEVRAVALTKHVDATVHANCLGAWAITNNDGANRHGGGEYSMHIEFVITYRFKCSDDPR